MRTEDSQSSNTGSIPVSATKAELDGTVEENFVAMLLGKREPEVGPPLIGKLQNAVGHFLRDVLLIDRGVDYLLAEAPEANISVWHILQESCRLLLVTPRAYSARMSYSWS